jgi:hypothetical protein
MLSDLVFFLIFFYPKSVLLGDLNGDGISILSFNFFKHDSFYLLRVLGLLKTDIFSGFF